ncbi:MAG TPA: hypothetical protein V6D17_02625 [Candidatus Obscuribacterales bacterium]
MFSAFWLTACTYPIVNVVSRELLLPAFGEMTCISAAETFAPLFEFFIFRFTFCPDKPFLQCKGEFVVILLANLASFGTGLILLALGVLF